MDSPAKDHNLIDVNEKLEHGSDGIPQDVWEDIKQNESFIFYGLMFLNASVLWAYYSCLSAQDFYAVQFSESTLNFKFLTTLCTAWPMVGGHSFQVVFGLDKQFGMSKRVHVGYCLFILMAILIMVFSAIHFTNSNTGATLVLFCFGMIGATNSLTEAVFYSIAALFPVEKFTNAVQVGNVCAGVINITVSTIIRLIVGGFKQKKSNVKIAFYLFFSFLIVVCIAAVLVFRRLTALKSIRFLIERNEAANKSKDLAMNPLSVLSNLGRIFRQIWVPAIAQFLIFFVSLAVFPGFGCTATRNILGTELNALNEPVLTSWSEPMTASWYCAPGIVGAYNYGDFIGRISCSAIVYKILTMKVSFGLSILRIAFIPLMLMGVSGTDLYLFPQHSHAALVWNIVLTLLIGMTTGLLSTVTMGTAPRLVSHEDRESACAIMVFFLFLGIASGAHFGYLVNENAWLGL